jgi:CRISPR/Cas system-associated endoribonuclease Cas2
LLEQKRFKELKMKISQKYDSQKDNIRFEKISEKSMEETLGNAES